MLDGAKAVVGLAKSRPLRATEGSFMVQFLG